MLGAGEMLRGSFVQERVLQGFDGPLRSEGTFVLAPGSGLIWRTERPFAVVTLMTPNGLAQQSNGATTLNVPASRAPIMAGLYGMLTGALAGDWTELQKDFVVEKTEADGQWRLRLKSREGMPTGAMPITEIRISGAAFVDTVEIEKQGGDVDRLSFSQQQRGTTALTSQEKALLDAVGRP
ncbi:outer membrane lipoprotein carrier protein LolA [Dongia rigui]|uniref:Outer membrane lipoprotein carrier protein LolA n=1 Tax=Dongia rigui TaxID=940149 RepID=A0ABU5E149_9PROT|nr:outer membrane lipoprotein carrier protein LolA [Dongia rigui]MDY0873332.1 outer membrane lipoprotein carrier protein LolA [Dongia rigui]